MKLALGVVLFASGCIFGDANTMRDRVTTATREYNEGVRWGQYDHAVKYVSDLKRAHFLERHKTLEDELEFADCEVLDLDLDKKKARAVSHVEYSWILKREGLLKKTSVEQVWFERNGRWVVDSETRTKGSPLPLFDEPPKQP